MDFTKITNVLQWGETKGFTRAYMLAIWSQAVLESGNFTSGIYQNALNAFGMRVARKRQQIRNGVYDTKGNGKFASYSSVEDSFIDRINLDTFNGVMPPQTFEEIGNYMEIVLSKGYDPTNQDYYPAWANVVQQTYQRTDELNITPVTGFGFKKQMLLSSGIGLVLAGLGIYLFRDKLPFLKKLPLLGRVFK